MRVECTLTDSLLAQGFARVRFAVVDNGPGILPSQRSQLFQPFSQVTAPLGYRAPEKGTGLGLVICKRIVEAMGGSIGVDSEGAGRGATFWFELDLAKTAHVPPSPEVAHSSSLRSFRLAAPSSSLDPLSASGATTPRRMRMRVLVAEDNAVNAVLVCRMLQMCNCETVRSN